MKTTLWNALGIASKDKAMRLTLVDVVAGTAVILAQITDRKSGKVLYDFEPLRFNIPTKQSQNSVSIGLDAMVEVNADGVADLLSAGQEIEKENEKTP